MERRRSTILSRWAYLWPTLIVIVLSVPLAHMQFDFGASVNVIPFTSGSFVGALLNTLLYVGLFAAGGRLALELARREELFVPQVLIAGTFLIIGTFLTLSNLSALLEACKISDERLYGIFSGLCVDLGALISLVMSTRMLLSLRNPIVLYLAVSFGSLLAVQMPFISSALLLLGFSLFDLYAVGWGPYRGILELHDRQKRSLFATAFTARGYAIGMGDLALYSMTSSLALVRFGVVASISTCAGLLAGNYLSMRLFGKERHFPGLPVAVSCGLLAMLLASLLS